MFVNIVFYLLRSFDTHLVRQDIDDALSVVRRIASRYHPRLHMVHFPRRRKGNDVDKLGFHLARQLEHRIVGHHLLGRVCRIIRFLRDFPLLILVVKGFRIADVIVAIHFRLDAGEVIGEAEVAPATQPASRLSF